ncbi:MAG: hypothetical protein FJZ56_02915 [Chlamydiae bacterium]|nr:hypothetical protein [Chlamydiota bacterium]
MSTPSIGIGRQGTYRALKNEPVVLGYGSLNSGEKAQVLRSTKSSATSLVANAALKRNESDPSSQEVVKHFVEKGATSSKIAHAAFSSGTLKGFTDSLYANMKALPLTDMGNTETESDPLLKKESEDFHPQMHRDIIWAATDIPGLAQSAESLAMNVQGKSSDIGLSAGLKMSSTFGVLTGALGIGIAANAIERANKIQDTAEVNLAKIRMMRSTAEMSAGASFGTLRGLTIASAYTTAKTVVLATTIVGCVATALGSLSYLFLALGNAVNSLGQIRFYQDFAKVKKEGADQAFKFLLDKVLLKKEDREEASKIIPIDVYDDLILMASEERTLTAEELFLLTAEDRDFVEDKTKELMEILSKKHPDIGDLDVFESHIKIGLAKELSRMATVKQAELVRATGIETVTKLREFIINPQEALTENEIVGIAQKENKAALIMSFLVVTTCLIGVAGFITATVFSGGLPLIVGLALIVSSNVLMFGLDFYALRKAFKEMKAAPKDRIVMMVCAALSLFFTATGAFVATTTVVRIAVIILGILFAGVQVGVMGSLWYKEHKEKNKCQ